MTQAEAFPAPQAAARPGMPVARLLVWTGRVLAAFLALLAAAIVFLHTPPGRQFLLDRIAAYAPASGLSVQAGAIRGSVLWSASLMDVEFRDADGVLFLEVPEIELSWRPWNWFLSGLDIRHLVLVDGRLNAVPRLLPGDPETPILPDFDIHVGRLVVEDLHVAKAVLGQERVVQLRAKADIRRGRVLVDAAGDLGGKDVLRLLARAEPDGDVFDLDLEWNAPEGGFLATLTGVSRALDVHLRGQGSWTRWAGTLQARLGGEDLLDLELTNTAGQYRLAGRARPAGLTEGLAARALGADVQFTATGRFEARVAEGSFTMQGAALDVTGRGAIDLAENLFGGLQMDVRLLDPAVLGDAVVLEGAVLSARLDGPFASFTANHRLRVERILAGDVVAVDVVQQGILRRDQGRWLLPLDAAVGQVASGVEMLDPKLVRGTLRGALVLEGNRLSGDRLEVAFPDLSGELTLAADLPSGSIRVTGPVQATRLAANGIGLLDGNSRIDLAMGGGLPWTLGLRVDGKVARVTNATLETLAGPDIRFAGGLRLGEGLGLVFDSLHIGSGKLEGVFNGRLEGARAVLSGSGHHADYGQFAITARLADDGPQAELVLDAPFPAVSVRDVRVTLAPREDAFSIQAHGQSALGPFDGDFLLHVPGGEPLRLTVARMAVGEARLSGSLRLGADGADGLLNLTGGGMEGTLELSGKPEGQAFALLASARNTHLGAEPSLHIAQANIDLRGLVAHTEGEKNVLSATSLEGRIDAAGVGYGRLFIGRLAASLAVRDGEGSFDAAVAGQRGSRFALLLNGTARPQAITLALRGSHADRVIAMPRRAIITRTGDGGWQLERTLLSYGSGAIVASGRFGGNGPQTAQIALADIPLAIADTVLDDLGLGGSVSGVVNLAADRNGVPTGDARLLLSNLSRPGLFSSSHPLDLALVADLSPRLFQARAVMRDRTGTSGRVDAVVADLPSADVRGERGLVARIQAGSLRAQLRYQGPAEALWRLAGVEVLDVSGPVRLAADAHGTWSDPQVRGSLSGDGLQVQGPATGTSITNVIVRGRFDGARLRLTRFSGSAPGGGSVVGSGLVDFSGMAGDRGPQIDIRLAARDARLLQLPGMRATITGPMRFVSDGIDGTIAGRLEVCEAFWRLGAAREAATLPDVKVTHVNLPPDSAPARRPARPWRYLVDARAVRGLEVDGMGLDSEWGGEIRLRGTTADPRLGGEVRIVPRQGYYTFAGVRLEITRGRIDFDEGEPPNPRLDILAETDVDGLGVDVTVRGSASRAEIVFSSTPALPEEELLARLLFGGSVTNLSATDALQLGAALAALRGGEGLDPINRLRTAIGLDRLRIVPADAALNHGTAVALGKNVTRRLYVELITDGQGYNATELEYRITRWISLLAAVNTLGRGSVAAAYTRDY